MSVGCKGEVKRKSMKKSSFFLFTQQQHRARSQRRRGQRSGRAVFRKRQVNRSEATVANLLNLTQFIQRGFEFLHAGVRQVEMSGVL